MIRRRAKKDQRDGDSREPMIVTDCPDCGVVCVEARSMTVMVDAGPDGAVRATFACPQCHRRTGHRLQRAGLAGLQAMGVPVRLLTRPAEADEVHDGPPITDEDVEAFQAALDDPAWPRHLA